MVLVGGRRDFDTDGARCVALEENPSTYLVKLSDHHRVHVFDIVTQYQSIFGDDTGAEESKAQARRDNAS